MVEETPRPEEAASKRATSPTLNSMSTGVPVGTWSPSEFAETRPTPYPQERSRLGQVFDLFRRRATSTCRHDVGVARSIPSLNETRQQVQQYVTEVETLHRRLEATEAELQARQATTAALEAANRHAQELLKRNTELEVMIAHVQDESESLLREEQRHHIESLEALKSSHNNIEELNSLVALLRSREPSSSVTEEVKQLKLMLTQHELDLASVRAELDQNKVYIAELETTLKDEKATITRLYNERRQQLASLTDIGSELDLLIKENKSLDQSLTEARQATEQETNRGRMKLKEVQETLKVKDRHIAELKVEAEMRSQDLKTFTTTLEQLKRQNTLLQEKCKSQEAAECQSTQLSERLHHSEERRKIEQAHHDENLKRMKARLASLEGIQQRASDLLSRNSELECLVSDLRRKISLLSKIPEGDVVRQLKDQIKSKSTALTGAQETLRAQAADIKLLEKTLLDHRRRLQAAEIEASRNKQPLNVGPETKAWQLAVEKVMAATRDDARKEIDRIIREYDCLVRSIREAHIKELESREIEFNERLQRSESVQQSEAIAIQRQHDLEKQMEQLRAELQSILLRKDQDLEVYKEEFERSFSRLQARKLEEVRDQLGKKEEMCRQLREQMMIDSQKMHSKYEAEIEEIKRGNDLSALEKNKKIGKLEAELVSVREKIASREKELDTEIQHEATLIAEKLVQQYRTDFDSWLEREKQNHSREVNRIREEFRVTLDDSHRENDKLRVDNELDVANMKRDHEERMAELRTSLNDLVAQATAGLKNDLTTIRDQLSDAQAERNKACDESLRLGREVNRLRAGLDERDAEIERMVKQYRDLEVVHNHNLKDIQAMADLAASKIQPIDEMRKFEDLLERNAQLEEIIATMSEKYHDELKIRLEHSSDLAEVKAQYDASIRSLMSQIAELKTVTANPCDSDEFRASLETKLADLCSQLSQTQIDKQQLEDDLETERSRVTSLRQQLTEHVEAGEERRSMKVRLLKKIKDIEQLAKSWASPPTDTEQEDAKSMAERKRLQAEVGSLRTLVMDRQNTIVLLEASLKDRRHSRADELASEIKVLQQERKSLMSETQLLESSLRRQEETLTNEIKQRDERLKCLNCANKNLSEALERNSQLENEVQKLLKELHQSCRDMIDKDERSTMMIEIVEKFEDEFRIRATIHDEDLRTLHSQLDEREAEISRLDNDLRRLKTELEVNHQEQMRSQKLVYEARNKKLHDENVDLIEQRRDLEIALAQIREELKEANQNGSERVNEMILDLSDKLRDREYTIAEMQNEKDDKNRQYEAQLKVADQVKQKLQAEIDKVSTELAAKEADIVELTKAIKDIMTLEGLEDANLDEILSSPQEEPILTGEKWSTLMGTLESLFFRLSKSQKSAKGLLQMLNALLKEQQESLMSIAASQAAAVENHTLMYQAVRTDIADSSTSTIKPSFAVHGGDLSILESGLVTLQKELSALKETRKSVSDAIVRRRPSPSGGSTRSTMASPRHSGKRRLEAESEGNKRARLVPQQIFLVDV